MLVRDVMSNWVLSVGRTEPVHSVVARMLNRHYGAIPIVSDDNRLIGIVTLRDVLLPLYPNYGEYIHDNVHGRDFIEMEEAYPDVLAKKAEEIMSRHPLTVAPGDPVLQAASYMGLQNFRRIPVVDKGKGEGEGTLVGMLSIGDIHRGLFAASVPEPSSRPTTVADRAAS